jgi:hypothetical protein
MLTGQNRASIIVRVLLKDRQLLSSIDDLTAGPEFEQVEAGNAPSNSPLGVPAIHSISGVLQNHNLNPVAFRSVFISNPQVVSQTIANLHEGKQREMTQSRP